MIISIILGVFGALIGGYMVDYFGLAVGSGFFVRILVATTGAILLILCLRLFWKIWADKNSPTPSFLPVWGCMLLSMPICQAVMALRTLSMPFMR